MGHRGPRDRALAEICWKYLELPGLLRVGRSRLTRLWDCCLLETKATGLIGFRVTHLVRLQMRDLGTLSRLAADLACLAHPN